MDICRNKENMVKDAYQGHIGLNGGLSYVKRWVFAEKDIWISVFHGAGAAFTKKRFRGVKKNIYALKWRT